MEVTNLLALLLLLAAAGLDQVKRGEGGEKRSRHSLRGLHDVPAAAVLHVGPFPRLLTEIHHLICTFAVKIAHEGVCRSWPVAVGVAPMSVVTVVTLHLQQRAGMFTVWQPLRLQVIFTNNSPLFQSNLTHGLS